jgi:hypothetical protein
MVGFLIGFAVSQRSGAMIGRGAAPATQRQNTASGGAMRLSVGIIRRVIASKPALQLGMRIISPIGSDPLGVRRIDGQLNARAAAHRGSLG